MFTGHSICSLDAKSRIIMPAKFRKYIKPEADNKLFLTKGMDDCILVYPQDEWQKVVTVFQKYNPFNENQSSFIRRFLFDACECEFDSQNRILIPNPLIKYAKLKKDVMVLGQIDKLEIWDPESKEEYDNSMDETYEEIAEKVSEEINLSLNND